jgi:hypothetical protein
MSAKITVEVLYFSGCPHAEAARALVRDCLARLDLDVAIVERDGDYASPTVLVNGRDVMGAVESAGRSCRRDLPTEERLMAALVAAR